MSDDDHKITVETETVEAPVSGLLLANAEANRPSSVKQTGAGGPMAGGLEAEGAVHEDGGVHAAGGVNPQSSAVSVDAALTTNNGKAGSAGALPAMFHEGMASSVAAPGGSINLIDHNPLSPHVTQTALRNKKSSLLIDSSLKNKGKKGKEAEEVPSVASKGEADGVGTALEEGAKEMEHHHHVGHHNASGQSSKTGTSVPTPLMLPVAATAIDPKPSKIMERSALPPMNSREILLEEKKPASNTHGGPGPGKTGTHSGGHEDNSNLRQVSSSSHHAEEVAHDRDSLNKPTKADIFAARLASAVGENDVSDSEETFIYESAANSTKNNVAPIIIDSQTDQQHAHLQQHLQHHPQHQQHGIAPKMSAPLLNNSAKLLTRLKDTRHTSMSALPMSGSAKNSIPTQYLNMSNANMMTSASQTDDLKSVNSINRQNSNNRQVDIQSVKSFISEPRSPDKRLSLVSLAKGNNSGTLRSGNPGNTNTNTNTSSSRKASVSNSTLRYASSSQPGVARSKASPNEAYVNNPGIPSNAIHLKRNLRTTASKIFDANGAPLRRYSGVPDDINLEDYIEQADGHIIPAKSNSIKRDDRSRGVGEGAHQNEFKRTSHDLTEFEHRSTIQEEDDEQDNQDAEDDDMRSMFYYNHRGDLEARPQISDYDEDDDELEDDTHEDQYYAYPYNNEFVTTKNSNGNLNRRGRYFGSLPPVFQANAVSNANPSANEFTPLKPKKQFLRDQIGYSPHNFYTRKSSWAKIKHFIYFSFIVLSLLTVGFILGFLLATNKELQDFNIVIIDNILSSADELLFDITATAFNPGFFVLEMQYVDLDIFAKTAYLTKTSIEGGSKEKEKPPLTETVRLGTVYKLETPLKFGGGFFKRNYDVAMSSVKLLDPGSKTGFSDEEDILYSQQGKNGDAEKWKSLIKHDYDLIIRGNMKYKIPFFRSEKSVAVSGSVEVHPGKDDDDDGDDGTGFLSNLL